MKKRSAFLLAACGLISLRLDASQSLQLNSSVTTGTFTLPSVAPLNSPSAMQNQTVRMEFRMTSFSIPPNAASRAQLFGFFNVQLWETGEVCGYDGADVTPDYGALSCAPTDGHADVTIRVTRDAALRNFLVQSFDTVTGRLIGGYCGYSANSIRVGGCPVQSLGAVSWSGTFGLNRSLGTPAPQNVNLAWLKLYLSAPPQYPVATGESAEANVADFRFENSLIDQSTGRYGATVSYPDPHYVSTTDYPPVCAPGAPQVVRAGGAILTLDGSGSYALSGDGSLSYTWQKTTGTGAPKWTSQKNSVTSVSGLLFGEHTFQLSVTDSRGAVSTCSVVHSAVAADNNNVVITDNSQMDHLLSPTLMLGKSPWPWFDSVLQQTGRYFADSQASILDPVWRKPSTHGTVSVPMVVGYAGVSVAGTGTSFAADFFSGSCSNPWDGTHKLTLWYTTPWGTRGYRNFTPTSCADDTHMHVAECTQFLVTPVIDSQYSTMTEAQFGPWINGSNNVNYYDNVLAFYSLWRRTGLSYWHTAATTLADLWWESPNVDQGLACWDGGHPGYGYENYWCTPPRVRASLGILLRAADGRPEWWANGIYLWIANLATNDPAANIIDVREDSAQMGQVCTAAMFMQELGYDGGYLTAFQNYCAGMVRTHFAPRVRPNGEFVSPQYGLSSNNLGYSTVTVGSGSRIVTSSGNDFPCRSMTTGTGDGATRFWLVPDNSLASLTAGDSMSYAIDSCTPSTITLHTNYAGALAGSGRGYVANGIGGPITQPFMMGYMASQFTFASEALTTWGDTTTSQTARNIAGGLASWILNPVYGGYRPATGGLFYRRNGLTNDGTVGGPDGAGGCEPDPEVANNNGGSCVGADRDVQSTRFLGTETIRGISHAYLNFPSAALKSAMDDFYGKMWGGLGGPGADGNYLSTFFPSTKAKDFGFASGMGGGNQWPAARLGGTAPQSPRTVKIPFRLSDISGANMTRITVTNPSGKSTVTVCAVSPCSVSVDRRQGDHLFKLDYLDGSGRTVASGEQRLLRVPR